jgi:hypothetical protein
MARVRTSGNGRASRVQLTEVLIMAECWRRDGGFREPTTVASSADSMRLGADFASFNAARFSSLGGLEGRSAGAVPQLPRLPAVRIGA